MQRNLPADAWAFGHDELGRKPPFQFQADRMIGKYAYRNPVLRGVRSRIFFRRVTHVALDGYSPYFHLRRKGKIGRDARWLAENGYRVALVAHGSDVRDPDLHLATDPWSYFREGSVAWLDSMRASSSHNRAAAEESGLPLFYSTPDMAADLPTGTWLPVCLDVDAWSTDAPLLERSAPRVMHIPSNHVLKGSHYIDPALRELAARGVIEYVAPQSVPHAHMKALVRNCDVVVDQILFGSYGVAALEAMAAGRVVVGRVRDDVKARMPEALHILDATPEDITDVVLSILDRREELRSNAVENVAFVRRWHDGKESALRLAGFLGVERR